MCCASWTGTVRHCSTTNELGWVTGRAEIGAAKRLTLLQLGRTHLVLGEYTRAEASLDEALDAARDVGDRRGEAYALHASGAVYAACGRAPVAVRAWDGALHAALQLGGRYLEALVHNSMGDMLLAEGGVGPAAALFARALELFTELDMPTRVAGTRDRLEQGLKAG